MRKLISLFLLLTMYFSNSFLLDPIIFPQAGDQLLVLGFVSIHGTFACIRSDIEGGGRFAG